MLGVPTLILTATTERGIENFSRDLCLKSFSESFRIWSRIGSDWIESDLASVRTHSLKVELDIGVLRSSRKSIVEVDFEMASAEVLSNSAVSFRKQALEAGKRRLEEFRKKKAAKAAASGQPRGADSAVHEKQASENGQMQPKQEGDDPISLGLMWQTSSTFQQVKENRVGGFETDTKEEMYDVAISSAGCIAPRHDSSTYFHSTFDRGYVDFMHHTADRPAYAAEPFSQNSTLFVKGNLTAISGGNLDAPEENLSSFCRHQATEPPSAGFDISVTLNGPLYSSVADTFPRRFRPSFLDSLNIGRDLPVSGRQEAYTSPAKFSSSLGAPSAMQEPSTACAPEEPRPMPASTNTTSGFFGSSFTGQKLFENNLESDLQRHRPDEDFAALEQI